MINSESNSIAVFQNFSLRFNILKKNKLTLLLEIFKNFLKTKKTNPGYFMTYNVDSPLRYENKISMEVGTLYIEKWCPLSWAIDVWKFCLFQSSLIFNGNHDISISNLVFVDAGNDNKEVEVRKRKKRNSDSASGFKEHNSSKDIPLDSGKVLELAIEPLKSVQTDFR